MGEKKYRIYMNNVLVCEVFESYISAIVKGLFHEFWAESGMTVTIQRENDDGEFEKL